MSRLKRPLERPGDCGDAVAAMERKSTLKRVSLRSARAHDKTRKPQGRQSRARKAAKVEAKILAGAGCLSGLHVEGGWAKGAQGMLRGRYDVCESQVGTHVKESVPRPMAMHAPHRVGSDLPFNFAATGASSTAH